MPPARKHPEIPHLFQKHHVQTVKKPQASVKHAPHPNLKFQPLPPPTGQAPYRFSLNDVISSDQLSTINSTKAISFHITGDTGGVKFPEPQKIVEIAMQSQFEPSGNNDDDNDGSSIPSFFYHLGDVVYYYGEEDEYYSQFYDPYAHYPAPIFAIPGNHDGDINPTDPAPASLTGFVKNFCAKTKGEITRDAGDVYRAAMVQPNVYWTLLAPYITVVGLYSNVPEGGEIHQDQIDWFVKELNDAPEDKALAVAVHHPLYSLDEHHSGSKAMQKILDDAFKESQRNPDIVFSGHVHNYQRFTRTIDGGEQIPYVVAGAGGYWHLHYMQKVNGNLIEVPYEVPDEKVTLESYCENRHGFMRVHVNEETLVGEYYAAPRPHESWRSQVQKIDSFELDLKKHTVKSLPLPP